MAHPSPLSPRARSGTPETVDLAAVATRVVERFRTDDHPGSVALECPDAVRIASHRPVVERILAELVENGLVHSDAADPSVEIRVREGPDAAAELVVADDGPGLPDRVREMLTTGTETPLNHGHGIGLWFVNWAVTQLGGELRFRETDTGTVVTITFYDMDHDLSITG